MIRSFFGRHSGYAIQAYVGALVLLVILVGQVGMAVLYNTAYAVLMDMLAKALVHTPAQLWYGLLLIGLVALSDVVLGAFSGYARKVYVVWWREAMTTYYITQWQKIAVHIEGAAQRIQEDIREFADTAENLGIEALRATLTLVAFVPILLELNACITSGVLAWEWSLVVVIVVSTIVSVWGAAQIGKPIVRMETRAQALEAYFRTRLVHAEHDRTHVRDWGRYFYPLIQNYRNMYLRYALFEAWTIGYDKVMMMLPYVLCLAYLHAGVLSFETFVKLVHAFGTVQLGLAFILKNGPQLVRFWSVCVRLRQFEKAFSEHEVGDRENT